jgi:hypothetical protein
MPKWEQRNIIIIFIFGGIIHLVVWLSAIYYESYWWPDSVQYVTIAQNYLCNNGYSQQYHRPYIIDFERTPGYPFILIITGINYTFILFLQHIAIAFSAWLIYKICNLLTVNRCGVWAAAIWWAAPYPALYASILLSESFFIPIILLNCYFSLKCLAKFSFLNALLTGICISCATYIKPVALPIAILLPVIIMLLNRKSQIIKNSIIIYIVISICLVPYIVYNYLLTNRLFFSTLSHNSTFYGRLGGLLAYQKSLSFDDEIIFSQADSLFYNTYPYVQLKTYVNPGYCTWETALLDDKIYQLTFEYLIYRPIQTISYTIYTMGLTAGGIGFQTALKLTQNQYIAVILAIIQVLILLFVFIGILLASLRIAAIFNYQVQIILFFIIILLLPHTTAMAEGRFRLIIDPFILIISAVSYCRVIRVLNAPQRNQ